jgi:hypothetical protein
MKSFSLETIVLAAMLSCFAPLTAGAANLAAPAPEQVSVLSDAIFAPSGFGETHNAQLVAKGSLPGTCYKVFQPQVTVDRDNHRIAVALRALHYSIEGCVQLPVPFTQTIDLGLLPVGRYHVVESDSAGKTAHEVTLTISASISAAPDDFMYAPVAHERLTRTAGGNTVILDGAFSADCMDLREVRVLHRVAHVLELLPVAMIRPMTCAPVSKPFETRVALPQMEAGETLIRVRTLSGVSLNEVERF